MIVTRLQWFLLGPCVGVLAGCGAAPSLTVVGSYFPAWLACGIIGVVAAIVARIVFVATGLVDTLPLQLYVCAAIGIVAACLIWLVWVG
jgi:YtcA family